MVQKGCIQAELGGPRDICFMIAFVPLSKSCFPPRAGSICFENRMIFCKKKKVLEAWKAQRKQQIVYEIDKIVASMHTLIFADGALGAKNARDCSQKQYFDAGMERKNGDRNGQKSEKSKHNYKKCSYWGRMGVKKKKILIRIAWSRFAKMLSPLEQEQQFWKNAMRKVSWTWKA